MSRTEKDARVSRKPRDSKPKETPTNRVYLLFNHPLSTYYLLLGATMLLLTLGLIMVLSASSIESLRIFDSSYALFTRQLMFAVGGVILMFVLARRTSSQFWRGIALLLLAIAVISLIVVLVIGVSVNGQKNWIELFGPFRVQPSEFAKLALVVWGADQLARNAREYYSWKTLLLPVLPVALALMVLVVLEGDVGNTFLLAVIFLGMMFAAGAPMRLFVYAAIAAAFGMLIASLAAPYRMARFTAWLDPNADPLGAAYQVNQGQMALGTGGFLGVGVGGSREKWGSLPEAHTDFIFSVIGEELGLVGTITIIVLFALLAFAIFRLSRTTKDRFVRFAAAGVGCWIIGQATLNIGAVLGLLPITGVPLPLVSYGGSSLIPTLAALGMLLACARNEPAARTALRRKSTAESLRRR
jgi:cell division protein FtsW